jgi:hypothetical protein
MPAACHRVLPDRADAALATISGRVPACASFRTPTTPVRPAKPTITHQVALLEPTTLWPRCRQGHHLFNSLTIADGFKLQIRPGSCAATVQGQRHAGAGSLGNHPRGLNQATGSSPWRTSAGAAPLRSKSRIWGKEGRREEAVGHPAGARPKGSRSTAARPLSHEEPPGQPELPQWPPVPCWLAGHLGAVPHHPTAARKGLPPLAVAHALPVSFFPLGSLL